MQNFYNYFANKNQTRIMPNTWDLMALVLVLSVLGLVAWGAKQMSAPYQLGQTLQVSLNPRELPVYGLFTVLRMLIAMLFSLLFTFIFGTWAAKSRQAARLIIPCIDILQSVPVLPMLSITITGFIALFPGSRLGPECAAIFTVFTAQVWNMVLSFYQSLRIIPQDLKEAADMFHLSAWQRFWRIEVPFAMPGLLWNMMLSMSGCWLFIVASEAISVANQHISLPGIGSYLNLAITQANISAVGYAIITMLIIIFCYDQLLFRPLLTWAEKFRTEDTAQEKITPSWIISLLHRTRLFQYIGNTLNNFADFIINFRLFHRKTINISITENPRLIHWSNIIWNVILTGIIITSAYWLISYIYTHITIQELLHVFLLGLITALRVLIIVLISTIVWVPIGVWIGLRPRIAEIIQPIVQFLAAFPMNVLFPVVVLAIVKFHLNVEIWVTPLMLLGVQWYILFNVVAGTIALPKDLKQVADNFGVRGWQWWKRLILPGIFPFYITGAITAVGNAWNTSIIAEVVSWGNTRLTATGLGAYITEYSTAGDFPRIALGMGVMCIFVLVMNRLVWRPLYNLAQTRYRLD